MKILMGIGILVFILLVIGAVIAGVVEDAKNNKENKNN